MADGSIPNEFLDEPSAVLGGGGGSGMFSVPLNFTGGAAAPSSVGATQNPIMNNAFSFAANGSKASATSTADEPTSGAFGLPVETLAFLAVLALLAAAVVRKKS